MALSKDELARKVAEFLGQPVSVKFTEAEREDRSQSLLDDLCGPGDEVLAGFLYEIAEGKTGRDVLKNDRIVTVYPSAIEREGAIRMLRVWHRGLAQKQVKIEKTTTHKVKWDPNSLSLEDLNKLESMQRKALSAGQTVEGEFQETDVEGEE